MAEEGFKRKLTAILSADVAGYSRLMAEDEASTVKTLADYRKVIASLTKQHHGRVVDTPGDNILAEFASVVDAVQCAVAVQKELETRNADLDESRKMEFRIGINLGDVIDEKEQIYGDGVNIAARLEALSDPGGICISKTAFDQIETKLPLGYEFLGEQEVKNIPKPVPAYRVLMNAEAVGKVLGEKRFLGRYSRKTAMSAIIFLVMVAGVLVSWNIYLQQSKKVEPASVEKMAFPLPDKPSIAVLPFDNMSGDPEQDFIADGITENIITGLSKVPDLFVIARNSSFTYKGKPVKIQQVSEELGVRYVLEGSVQKSGDSIRITAQLIDAIKGNHIWAEKYDRKFKDIFALQDDITLNILKELHVEIAGLVGGFINTTGTDSPEAYLKLLKGYNYHFSYNKEDNTIARDLFKEAIALDPNYAAAYYGVGITYHKEVWMFSVKESRPKMKEWAQKTIAIDDSFAGGHSLMSIVYRMKGQFDKAIAEGEKAIELDPNGERTLSNQGMTLNMADRPEEALRLMEKALRLNPKPPATFYWQLGAVYHVLRRYEEAMAAYEPLFSDKSKRLSMIGHICMTFAYLELGREAEARNHAAEALKIRPGLPFAGWAKAILRYKDMEHLKRLMKPLDSVLYADAGKREIYVNEGTPFFKFEYPAKSVKQDLNPKFPLTVIRLQAPVVNLIRASVMDVPGDMILADMGPKYHLEWLKNSGTGSNIKIISNKPVILKDGTKAYRTEFEYSNAAGGYKVRSIVVSAFRDKKLVQLDIHAASGVQSVAWIVDSLTFK